MPTGSLGSLVATGQSTPLGSQLKLNENLQQRIQLHTLLLAIIIPYVQHPSARMSGHYAFKYSTPDELLADASANELFAAVKLTDECVC